MIKARLLIGIDVADFRWGKKEDPIVTVVGGSSSGSEVVGAWENRSN